MPTYDPIFTEKMLPGSHKEENRWQGIVRAGHLDLNLLRYAINACADTHFDGICITWFDQILKTNKDWLICERYQNSPYADDTYTEFLKMAKPEFVKFGIDKLACGDELFDFVDTLIRDWTWIPLSILSVGSTEVDKLYAKRI